MITISCPQCDRDDSLTLECEAIVLDPVTVAYDPASGLIVTDRRLDEDEVVDWQGSRVIGVQCTACEWTHDGEDWNDVLRPSS